MVMMVYSVVSEGNSILMQLVALSHVQLLYDYHTHLDLLVRTFLFMVTIELILLTILLFFGWMMLV